MMFTMYVKILDNGNIGIGRGTDVGSEIVFSYAESRDVAAAFEKLAQTAGKYKHSYKKIGLAGQGRTIKLGRTEDDRIIVSGDGQIFYCKEKEIRDLVQLLKNIPRIEVAPSSDYVHKTRLEAGVCIALTNGEKTLKLTLQEAALLSVSLESSKESMYYKDIINIGDRTVLVDMGLHLRRKIAIGNNVVEYASHEIDALIEGLHNSIMDVLTDTIKSMSTDSMVDVRIKSRAKRIEQDTLNILGKNKKAKEIARKFERMTGKILAPNTDADLQTKEFIELCKFVYSDLDSRNLESMFELIMATFLPDMR
jgi:hypothetical protein